MTALVILGRDGMGELATEEDFDSWVWYVVAHINEACGFPLEVEVEVERRLPRDVQSDEYSHDTAAGRATLLEAVAELWDRWCSEGTPV